ncbi:MAG: ATP-binding cassette domain-containing protein, partial [Anaerolineae bacterium]|nr:ATP-binding cassette domain-containing protein [Anaerolineae bacterium]
MIQEPKIRIEHVSYAYGGQPALRDVTWRVPAGSFALVVGASGTGKSTLLRCLNGLVPHLYGGVLRGRIRVGGRDPVALGPRAMSDLVGFVFQDPESQFVTRQVEDELAFAMENRNFDQALMRRRIEEVLDQLGIADLRARRVETLSGGQQQLVAIASVLTLQPQVLVLDEPTSQLDPQSAEQVLTILRHLNLDLGLTIVVSEHRLERVAQYADQICYLPARGEPPLIGEPRAVLREVALVPALVELGRRLNWQPLPLTIKEARPFAESLKVRLNDAPPAPRASRASNGARAVTVRDVEFSYDGHIALRGVSFDVRAGELVALMGRNGAGKSTLLKNIVGLLTPTRGAITVLGMDTRATPIEEITRRVGFVPQNPGRLLFNETLEEELRFTCRAHNLPTTRIGEWLERLDLSAHARAYPRDLSVGERQRAALAAILVAQPELLLLDEPTRGLDYVSKE